MYLPVFRGKAHHLIDEELPEINPHHDYSDKINHKEDGNYDSRNDVENVYRNINNCKNYSKGKKQCKVQF